MTVFTNPSFDGHEQVLFCNNSTTGLRAIIAIHNTTLGPALGGCRMYPYATDDEALRDVLRLSKGMSYKNSLAGLPLGGGKSVIIGDPHKDKTPEMMLAMGRFIDSLGGRYVGAEDSGTNVDDLKMMSHTTTSISGIKSRIDEHGIVLSGDPSPQTARGVFAGMVAAVKYKFAAKSLDGLTVAIQGFGNVGQVLGKLLVEAGARIIVAEPIKENHEVVYSLGGTIVGLDAIMTTKADIFAPCAMGAILNEQTIMDLKVSIVAGAANNQLDVVHDAVYFDRRRILYAPDYVINAGGVIYVYHEENPVSAGVLFSKIDGIEKTLNKIFARADMDGNTTAAVADRMAQDILYTR